jgi:exodeoxyribonuclease V beta subunit
MSTENFNPISTQLKTGINLIEASAGTGKTYAIAMLVLRFVVEKNFNIEQLLVVTFTKAATDELKDRIRARLAEARQLSYGCSDGVDDKIVKWFDELPLEIGLIKKRLEKALLNIDLAGIFTIHGFCQRILMEYALESGQLFGFELTAESHRIKQRCTDDYWRKQLYPRTALQVALLTSHYPTPEALLKSISGISLTANIVPEVKNLEDLLVQIEQLMNQAQLQFDSIYQTLKSSFDDEKFKKSYLDVFDEQAEKLNHWLKGHSLSLPKTDALNLLTEQGINKALNGVKFRKTKAQSSEERKAAYIKTLAINNTCFNELIAKIKKLTLHFRLGLVKALQLSVGAYLQQLNLLTFDDLITHLSTALIDDKSQLLTKALQQRFKVALIDEFQDTDNLQWTIFSSLFSTTSHYLYLIGDPKQAIYKFRGADIFSYFAAKDKAQHPFTLGHNWRSHPHLVTAVNILFSRDEAFLFEKLPFNPVEPALTTGAGEILFNEKSLAPMMLWQLAESNTQTGDWTSGKATEVIQIAIINEVVDLLTNNNYSLKQGENEPLKLMPKGIAILVRSNRQAREYQFALQQRGVPAVINSMESVFTSPQAFELYQLLNAVLMVADIEHLKQALMLDWFGLQGQDFYSLMNNEAQLDAWISRFSEYHLLWQQQGLMVMLSRLLAQERVYQHLSALPLAERILTNLNHLIELLQQAVTEKHLGMHKTLDYLAKAIQNAGGSDEQQLRLESDDNAVNIVTMHRSKGLEYKIVFCPFLWQSNDTLKQEKERIQCYVDGKMLTDLGSGDFETHRLKAIEEQLAEDLRILYVALTRAKYRCYIVWANVRTKLNPNNSALAYLMAFYGDDFKCQQQKIQNFAVQKSDVFAYALLDPEIELSGYYQTKPSAINFEAKSRQPFSENYWCISSYTSLAMLTQDELFDDKSQETEITANDLMPTLPKGSHTGNVIHSLLEFNHFKKLADPKTDINEQRDRTCLHYGLTLDNPEVLNQLLQTVVSTPLSLTDENFCLKNLNSWQCIKEMPFYLAVKLFNVKQFNQILKNCKTYRPLNEKQLEGYLTGFIDLICEYNGRYYIMDYKSNYLSDYGIESLIAAMREHNYGLQYWLYSVVLHLYLQNRLPDYNYQQHFGGVHYLFVRGMAIGQPLSGVYYTLPDLEILNALAAVFG